jgi:hypothetical protein
MPVDVLEFGVSACGVKEVKLTVLLNILLFVYSVNLTDGVVSK